MEAYIVAGFRTGVGKANKEAGFVLPGLMI